MIDDDFCARPFGIWQSLPFIYCYRTYPCLLTENRVKMGRGK